MTLMVKDKDELIKNCREEFERRGYTIEKADIDHDCFTFRGKNPRGQTVVVEMPVCMVTD